MNLQSCNQCDYPRHGSAGEVCPECGTPWERSERADREEELHGYWLPREARRLVRRILLIALLALAVGLAGVGWTAYIRDGRLHRQSYAMLSTMRNSAISTSANASPLAQPDPVGPIFLTVTSKLQLNHEWARHLGRCRSCQLLALSPLREAIGSAVERENYARSLFALGVPGVVEAVAGAWKSSPSYYEGEFALHTALLRSCRESAELALEPLRGGLDCRRRLLAARVLEANMPFVKLDELTGISTHTNCPEADAIVRRVIECVTARDR